jgi:hypothetical protein
VVRVLRSVLLCVLWGVAGALVALVPGLVWINWIVQSGGTEGSNQMGLAILVGYVLTPLGFVLGAAAGAVSVRRARSGARRDRDPPAPGGQAPARARQDADR